MPLNPVLFAASCSALAVHHSQKLELLLQHLLHQQFLGAEGAGRGKGAVISRKGCSVWEWGRLFARAEGWDAELVSFGVSCGVALLQVLPRASGSAVRSYYSLQFKWESY